MIIKRNDSLQNLKLFETPDTKVKLATNLGTC